MKLNVLDIICCPKCKNNIKVTKKGIICNKCNESYDIVQNLPTFIKRVDRELELTKTAFGGEYKQLIEKNNFDVYDNYSITDSNIIGDRQIDTFLELGCGRGRNCIIQATKGVKTVIGIDANIDALLLAMKIANKYEKNVYYSCADMRCLPIHNESIDVCFGGGSLEHFKETELAINEAFRVTKKGGEAIFTVPCISLTMLLQGFLTGNIPKIPILEEIAYYFHHIILKGKYLKSGFEYSFFPNTLRKYFLKSGFSSVEINYYDAFYDLKYVPSALRPLIRNILSNRVFWPMFTIKAKK